MKFNYFNLLISKSTSAVSLAQGDVFVILQEAQLYLIYDLPTGEAISKFAKTFVRLGWQYYDYDNFGSGDPNLYPYELDSSSSVLQTLNAYGMNSIDSANQVYLTFEAYF